MKLLLKIVKMTIIVLLFTALPLIVVSLITSNSILINKIRSFVVLSGSMQPAISTGSIVYTIPQSIYKNGEVISFKSGDSTVTHRIIKVIDKDGSVFYQTKGDANNTVDTQLISLSDIYGKSIITVPYLGRLIVFLKTPLGFFYGIIFPMIVFVIMEIWNLKKEIEKETEKKIRLKLKLHQDNISVLT